MESTSIVRDLRPWTMPPDPELGDFPSDLIYTIEREKLDKATVKSVLDEFAMTVSLGEVSQQARAIVVTDESQTNLMRQAGDLRIRLRDERLRIDKIRETVKKPYLLKTQAIDGIARIIRTKFQEEETYLAEQEQFAKIQQRKREDALKAERIAKLSEYAYGGDTADIAKVSDSVFELILAGAKATYAEQLEDIARRGREQKEQAERERLLREENDRLRREQEESDRKIREAEAAAQHEKDEADRRVQEAEEAERRIREDSERRERERLEAEAAERRRIADEKAKAAAAPDRDKLIAFADALASIELPSFISPDAQKLADRIAHDRDLLVTRIKAEAESVRFSDVPF